MKHNVSFSERKVHPRRSDSHPFFSFIIYAMIKCNIYNLIYIQLYVCNFVNWKSKGVDLLKNTSPGLQLIIGKMNIELHTW